MTEALVSNNRFIKIVGKQGLYSSFMQLVFYYLKNVVKDSYHKKMILSVTQLASPGVFPEQEQLHIAVQFNPALAHLHLVHRPLHEQVKNNFLHSSIASL